MSRYGVPRPRLEVGCDERRDSSRVTSRSLTERIARIHTEALQYPDPVACRLDRLRRQLSSGQPELGQGHGLTEGIVQPALARNHLCTVTRPRSSLSIVHTSRHYV